MSVRFVDLQPAIGALRAEIDRAIGRVIDSGRFVLGPEVEAFERELAAHCAIAHAVGVASGTDALELALRAVGVGPGDEVITVSHTFIATALAVSATGATPVFVDVGDDGLIDPAAAAAAVTPRTRAIVPVHLYGRLADMAAIGELAAEHGLRVVEDAAQAHGAVRAGRRAGSFGDAGCFSFYPTKNLAALGDGGAVVTGDAQIAQRLSLLRNYGETRKHEHATAGRNSRLDELQAAVLRVRLGYLDADNDARRALAAVYAGALAGAPVTVPARGGEDDAVHLYVVRSARRNELMAHLREAGIGTQVHYPIPAHAQAVYRDVPTRHPLPRTDAWAREVLSLPMYVGLSDEQVEAVADAIGTFSVA